MMMMMMAAAAAAASYISLQSGTRECCAVNRVGRLANERATERPATMGNMIQAERAATN